MTEELINRARQILIYNDKEGAIQHLINEGVEPEMAFLAVSAAEILEKEI